jgi:hypothetical protein
MAPFATRVKACVPSVRTETRVVEPRSLTHVTLNPQALQPTSRRTARDTATLNFRGLCTSVDGSLRRSPVFENGTIKVRCGTRMLSLGQALKGSVLWLSEHSNWQRGFWQCSNFTGFTHPTKQTNKQTNNHAIMGLIFIIYPMAQLPIRHN